MTRFSGPQLQSVVTADGQLELSLTEVAVSPPSEREVIIEVQAAPVNPSDLALLVGAADLTTASASGSGDSRRLSASIPPAWLPALAARIGQALPVGNEGAGRVVEAGSSEDARALVGRLVATRGGAMYGRFRKAAVSECLVLPEGVDAEQGASSFVNPMTALAMVETMRRDGHTALVHTAAASNLGQMLNRLCQLEGIPLVNIVRSPGQAELLRGAGAKHVVNSTSADFMAELVQALRTTGATLAFDAVGGGGLVNAILLAMETVAAGNASYSRYGSEVRKQAYIYGALDFGPTELSRGLGFAWTVGGWLLTHFLNSVDPETEQRLRERVASELTTTFASHYTRTVALEDLLDPATLAAMNRRATGEKFLLDPRLRSQ